MDKNEQRKTIFATVHMRNENKQPNDNDSQEFQLTSETRKENHIRMVNEKLNEKIPRLVKEMNLQHIL